MRRVVLLVVSWSLIALAPAARVPEAIAASPLRWNTFLGSARDDFAWGVAVDAGGNTYVNGYSFDTWGEPLRPFTGRGSAFAAKFDAAGALVWNTFLGAAPGPESIAGGIALDDTGNVYVTGIAYEGEWNDPIRAYGGGMYDGFVAKLDPSGNVVWSTYLGGGGDFDFARAIAVDAGGNVFVTGESDASWGAPIRSFVVGNQNAFVARLDGEGALVWNTFLGGTKGWDIAVGPGGGPCVVGPSGPWGEPLRPFSGGQDAFVAGLDADGAVAWNTFLGGAGVDWGLGVAIDALGDVYVSGTSDSSWGEPRRAHASYEDAFVAKLSTGGHLLWNTFLGGAGGDWGSGVALDAGGGVYVVGSGNSGWGDPILPWAGNFDVSVAKLDADGDLAWHTFLGGPASEGGAGIAVGPDGTIALTGLAHFTWGDPIRPFSGGSDPFVAALRVPIPVAADQWLVTAEDSALPIALSAADPDGGDLTYSVVAAPAHGTLSGTPPALVYHPAADFNGADSFSFTADNGLIESAAAVVSITVTPVNDAPSLGPLGAAQTREGQLLEFTVTAADPDGEIPALSGGALPEGSSFDPATGLFSWRPRFDQAGEYAVTFAATDAAGASDASAVAISVLPPSGPVFEDDFADATGEGDPHWVRVAGRFAGGGGRYATTSTSGLNLARVAQLAPGALPLGAGSVKARVRLTPAAGGREPNAMLVFAYRDAMHFRWAKITPSAVVIGQRGRIDGVAPGIKASARARHVPGRWYGVRVAVSPDGWVRVFRGGAAAPAASFRFRSSSGPSVAPGGVGLAADRATSLFDDVAVWDDPTPAP